MTNEDIRQARDELRREFGYSRKRQTFGALAINV